MLVGKTFINTDKRVIVEAHLVNGGFILKKDINNKKTAYPIPSNIKTIDHAIAIAEEEFNREIYYQERINR